MSIAPTIELEQIDRTLVRASPVMQNIITQAEVFAKSDCPILLLGETGVGKTMLAGHIHSTSGRKGNFISFNCTAVPQTLIEGELFGAEKGAYTGSDHRRIGRFEQANGGTLFIDEIGELSAELQAKLLKPVEEKRFTRLGGSEEIAVDVRIITGTHRDIDQMEADGAFRSDLLYRLDVLSLVIPPLRERREDLFELAKLRLDCHGFVLSEEAVTILTAHSWPGNIRELNNVLYRAMALAELDTPRSPNIAGRHISFGRKKSRGQSTIAIAIGGYQLGRIREEAVADLDRALLEHGLKQFDGDSTLVANWMGVPVDGVERYIEARSR